MKYCSLFLLTIALTFSFSALFAVPISGTVRDAKTQEPIPFVNIVVQNTMNGTMSDIDGNFKLDVELPCSLLIKFVGYKSQLIVINENLKNIEIGLEEDIQELDEILVKPDNSFDLMMLRRVIRSRKNNNPDNHEILIYRNYTRLSAFLANLKNEEVKSSRVWKKSSHALLKDSDTTFLAPFFINGTITSHYRNKAEGIDREELIAEKNDGVFNETKTQVKNVISKKLTTEFNFYNNQIVIMGRGFPSPISTGTLLHYKVYVTDSIIRKNVKYYKFNFYPKSYKSVTFKGYFWVENKTWALTELSVSLPNSANLNYVSNLNVHVIYQRLSSGKWFYKEQKTKLKLSIQKEKDDRPRRKGFVVQKLNVYSEAGTPKKPKNANSYKQTLNALVADSLLSLERNTVPLDTLEVAAYNGIKEIRKNPFFKFVDKFSAMTLSGYYNLGKLDLGPYFSFYRKNEIEGNRISLPLRTSEKMFENFMVGGIVGYGFKNKEFAFTSDIAYQFKTPKRTILKGHFHYDYFDLTRNKFIEFIKENSYQQGSGNVLSSFTAAEPNPYMIRNRQFNVTLEHQLTDNIGLLVRPALNRYYGNPNVLFSHTKLTQPHFDTQNLMLDVRLSFSQDYDEEFFSRIYYGNKKPVMHFTTLLGRYNLPNAQSNSSGWYANFNFSMKDRFNFGPAYLRTLVEAGAIVGDAPYPLLMLPRGARDIGSARYYFNLLHHSSYASDLYLSTHMALNGGGFVFNRLPLVKHLNLREIVAFKSFYGRLQGNHSKVLEIPDYLRAPDNTPYMELSFGVTNVFKVLRIDYVRRLNTEASYNQFSSKHGMRMRLEVAF